MRIKYSHAERAFDVINAILIGLFCLLTLYPFWNSMVVSLSPKSQAMGMALNLWPQEFDLTSWKSILGYSFIWKGFYNTVLRTVLGTIISVVLSVMTAYPITKKNFPHKKFFLVMIIFTMIFQGGLIPGYLLIRNLGMMNSIWALILPLAISPFQIIILINFFQSIPESLEESAKMDGANDIYILFKIVLPLSLPVIATICLWNMVNNWNQWFDALLYINDRNKYVLQVLLREIVVDRNIDSEMLVSGLHDLPPTPESIQAAATMFVTIPILVVYPFLQKYFTKGMMVGSIKE